MKFIERVEEIKDIVSKNYIIDDIDEENEQLYLIDKEDQDEYKAWVLTDVEYETHVKRHPQIDFSSLLVDGSYNAKEYNLVVEHWANSEY